MQINLGFSFKSQENRSFLSHPPFQWEDGDGPTYHREVSQVSLPCLAYSKVQRRERPLVPELKCKYRLGRKELALVERLSASLLQYFLVF